MTMCLPHAPSLPLFTLLRHTRDLHAIHVIISLPMLPYLHSVTIVYFTVLFACKLTYETVTQKKSVGVCNI